MDRLAAAMLAEAGVSWQQATADQRELARRQVAAVLAVLKEPTKEMILAGETAVEDHKDSTWDSGADGDVYDREFFTPGVERSVLRAMLGAIN